MLTKRISFTEYMKLKPNECIAWKYKGYPVRNTLQSDDGKTIVLCLDDFDKLLDDLITKRKKNDL